MSNNKIATEDKKRYRQLKRSLIKEHGQKYKNPRYWWLLSLLAAIGAVGTFFSVITRADLFDNLAPYTGVLLLVAGSVIVLHAALNNRKMPGWGFLIFPGALCAVMGAAILAWQYWLSEFIYSMADDGIFGAFASIVSYGYAYRITSCLSAYGFLGWALALISYGFSYKAVKGFWWIPIVIVGCISAIAPIMLLFQPLHLWLTMLQWTQVSFIALFLASCTVVIITAVQYHFFIKMHPIGPVFIR